MALFFFLLLVSTFFVNFTVLPTKQVDDISLILDFEFGSVMSFGQWNVNKCEMTPK